MSHDGSGGGLPPAGWHPDPAGSAKQRWWSGLEWTDHYQDAPPVAPVMPAAPAVPMTPAPPNPVWQPQVMAASTPPAYQPMGGGYQPMGGAPAAGGYQPMGNWSPGPSAREQLPSRPTGSPNTLPIWLFAFYPVGAFGAQLALLQMTGTALTTATTTATSSAALSISSFGLVYVVGLTIWDHFTLKSRGLPAANPFWLLLTIFGYFIRRWYVLRRVGVGSAAPGNVFVLVLIASSAAFTFLSMSSRDANAIEGLEMQTEKSLLDETSQVWTVECPDDVKGSVVGTEFTCSLTSDTGESHSMRVEVVGPWRFEITAAD